MNPKKEFTDNLESRGPADPHGYLSKIRTTTFSVPARAWEVARSKGFSFETVIDFTEADVFHALDTACSSINATHIDISGLWRPGAAPPHPKGRGLDMTLVRLESESARFLRDDAAPHAPVAEPFAAAQMFDALQSVAIVTQVLHPWRLLASGAVQTNTLRRSVKLEWDHRNHLHFTVRQRP